MTKEVTAAVKTTTNLFHKSFVAKPSGLIDGLDLATTNNKQQQLPDGARKIFDKLGIDVNNISAKTAAHLSDIYNCKDPFELKALAQDLSNKAQGLQNTSPDNSIKQQLTDPGMDFNAAPKCKL
ncbi:MAG: hypothetical protein ACHP9Y_01200 [Gammaproteobacteria bacterium]